MVSDFQMADLALPYQRKFIEAPQRKKLWLSSRQVGKSWTLAFVAVERALSRENGLSLCISTGARAASELLRKVVLFAEAVEKMSEGQVTFTASADTVRFSNGSRVLSLPSGNPSALRGYTSQAVIIDECSFIENADEVFAAIAPTLTRDRDAQLVVASTPAGRCGLFWDLYNQAVCGNEWFVQTTTVEQAVEDGLDVDVEELKRLVPPEVYEVEYMCNFAESYGSMLDVSQLEFVPDEEPFEGDSCYLGMDVGSTSDRTALVTLRRKDDVFLVDDVVVMHKATYESQLQVLGELHRKNGYSAGFIDATGIGSPLGEFANRKISTRLQGFTWHSQNKTPAYEFLRAQVFDHRLKFRQHLKATVIDDFSNVKRLVTESGKVVFEASRTKNGHSDVVSALVLALQAAKQRPASLGMPTAGLVRSANFLSRHVFSGLQKRL